MQTKLTVTSESQEADRIIGSSEKIQFEWRGYWVTVFGLSQFHAGGQSSGCCFAKSFGQESWKNDPRNAQPRCQSKPTQKRRTPLKKTYRASVINVTFIRHSFQFAWNKITLSRTKKPFHTIDNKTLLFDDLDCTEEVVARIASEVDRSD